MQNHYPPVKILLSRTHAPIINHQHTNALIEAIKVEVVQTKFTIRDAAAIKTLGTHLHKPVVTKATTKPIKVTQTSTLGSLRVTKGNESRTHTREIIYPVWCVKCLTWPNLAQHILIWPPLIVDRWLYRRDAALVVLINTVLRTAMLDSDVMFLVAYAITIQPFTITGMK